MATNGFKVKAASDQLYLDGRLIGKVKKHGRKFLVVTFALDLPGISFLPVVMCGAGKTISEAIVDCAARSSEFIKGQKQLKKRIDGYVKRIKENEVKHHG